MGRKDSKYHNRLRMDQMEQHLSKRHDDSMILVIDRMGKRRRVSSIWPGEKVIYDPTGRYLPGHKMKEFE